MAERYKRKSVKVGSFRGGGSIWVQISEGRELCPPTVGVRVAGWLPFVWYQNIRSASFSFVTMHVCDHVNSLLSSCASLLYALRVPRSHGTPTATLHDVFRATVIARMTYCAPAWSGSCSSADRKWLNSFLTRCKCFAYCDALLPPIDSLFKEADDMFFNRVINNSQHILETMLPVKRDSQYNLRTRTHDRLLIDMSADLNDCDFVVCMLYKSSY